MPFTWEVEITDEFYQTSAEYIARYAAPSKAKSLTTPKALRHFEKEGEQLVESLEQVEQLADKSLDLEPCARGPVHFSRELGVGPWKIFVFFRRDQNFAVVMPMFHESDLTEERNRGLIESAEERLNRQRGPQKRKNEPS